ncbi:aminopeptidase N [Frateuria aurantia]|uniref:Aminopeptidase N n=1 Tax=Frateuria aurantia (strain ATCC 33424 / DSM 6220 / KCTC 2777 / LMG 1558 / NBRC 3245 / NCIMB 13370) TaxID=767434 RepID=H8L0N7_FRAAD|nr:aminopeptidase N [Frateuria aurantia]AFC84663.1 aminopeptidase N [Frateuria aurantia DSM 6220]
MNKPAGMPAPLIRLADYQPPAWSVSDVDLEFDLAIERSEVRARLVLQAGPDPQAPLRFNGEGLELLEILLDGEPLPAGRYRHEHELLTIEGVRHGQVLETRVALAPAANTALEGLYLSGRRETGFLLTQCEAEGFRHITFFPDRPDVQARYTVTLRADRERFPVLLAGGNPAGHGELENGRHWARFVDPYPRPSYLFALVAGRLERISQDYRTADGRDVALHIWAEADVIDRCDYAMDALVRSMRWDEQVYGRNYDLDVFHVVATHDFNMGAMENKGLNIFNAKYLLADPDSSTDEEYLHVEAVVAHEYFHNWSGNRVTCRDWFQLSLKEGFTVFRDQSFSADMNSASLKRIQDVSTLRRAQFSEDAGPLSHPVRPAQYREINNFYTATVYEKGAELVRMLAGRVGPQAFRQGTDLYFERNDGRAATIEDFVGALGEASGIDLSPYLAWYGQAGTPRLQARGNYDPANGRYVLELAQSTAPTPDQPHKKALPIPVRLSLFNADGQAQRLRLADSEQDLGTETVLELTDQRQRFEFTGLSQPPIPSLLRGFSAPVVLDADYAPDQLAILLRHDPDGFNRWEAGQQLALMAYDRLYRGEDASAALQAWTEALADLFAQPDLDPGLLAELLSPPSETELAERQVDIDPEHIHHLRHQLNDAIAARIGLPPLLARYQALAAASTSALDASSQLRRRLKQVLLGLLSRLDAKVAIPLAQAQYATAPAMTDRLAALTVLLNTGAAEAGPALADYRRRYADNALAMDKWFAVQARVPGAAALARIEALAADPAFSLKNPNRVMSLLGIFARANASGFHRADGKGYAFVSHQLQVLDALNPQVAARLATALNGWRRLESGRREAAHAMLRELAARPQLSRNLAEIVNRILEG